MRAETKRLSQWVVLQPSLHSYCCQLSLPLFRRTSVSLRRNSQACSRSTQPSPLRRQIRLYSQAPASATIKRDLSGLSFAPLTSRSLLAVTGRDAASFLQGLTTNSIPFNTFGEDGAARVPRRALYTGFLNAQGRLLQDAIIYELPQSSALLKSMNVSTDSTDSDTSPAFLIEVDVSQAGSLFKSLRRYKLRSKVAVRQIEPQRATVVSIWGANASDEASANLIQRLSSAGACCRRDERAPHFGYRVIVPAEAFAQLTDAREASPNEYRLRRYLHGIPEGQAELPYEASLVHDSNLDYMHGVDFRKGCYVGQELVIRTQHTGVVRKRILPVMLYAKEAKPPASLAPAHDALETYPPIAYGTDINRLGEPEVSGRKSRSAGKWVANVGNVGLALARLETVAGLGPTGEKIEGWQRPELVLDQTVDGGNAQFRVIAFLPQWWNARRVLKAP